MIIYKDIFTEEELCSDIYKFEVVHDVAYKIRGKMVRKDCNIDESAIGGNKSAEGGDDEGVEDTSVQVINIVDAHQLQNLAAPHDKKSYRVYIKDYMKRLTDKLAENGMGEDDLKKVKKDLQEFIKEILGDFSNYEFYTSESKAFDMDGMHVLCKWEDDETVPCFYYFKHGLLEEKV